MTCQTLPGGVLEEASLAVDRTLMRILWILWGLKKTSTVAEKVFF